MFTGIIEAMGEITDVTETGTNRTYWVRSPLSSTFQVDQSVSHDGVCLTVEEVIGDRHRVTAVAETLGKTALREWTAGKAVNLEQSLLPSKRLDGHFVQGHVDTSGVCKEIEDKNGSWEFTFAFAEAFAPLVIEKGSIALNGTSLTVFDVSRDSFRVAIIPYTYNHTTLQFLKPGDTVNLEFDMVGKYITRQLELSRS